MFEEFRKFALRGNVVDMAVGIIIGGAFGTIVSSLVNDVLMPPIGLLFAGVNFSNIFIVLRQGAEVAGPYATVAAAREAGAVTMNVGMFINAVVSCTLVAIAVFMVVRTLNAAKRKEAAAPAPPPAPSAQETLLGEIRDLLKARV